MSKFKLVIPTESRNLAKNPSFETEPNSGIFTGWTHSGVFGFRDFGSPYPMFGDYFGLMYVNSAITAMTGVYTTITNPGGTRQFNISAWLNWPQGSTHDGLGALKIMFTDASNTVYASAEYPAEQRGKWVRVSLPVITSISSFRVWIGNNSTVPVAVNYYVDGVMVEDTSVASPSIYYDKESTYFDGDSPGCFWLGARNNSESVKPSTVQTGGKIVDFEDDLGIKVERVFGAGMPEVENVLTQNPLVAGMSYNTTVVDRSTISMLTTINGTSLDNYHDIRKTLAQTFSPDGRTVRVMYLRGLEQESEDTRYKDLRYVSGLQMSKTSGFSEQLELNFESENPFWYGRQMSVPTNLEDTGGLFTHGFEGLAKRSRVDNMGDVWSHLGLDNPAHGAGSVTRIDTILNDPREGRVFIGGQFTTFAGVANANNMVAWDEETETFETVWTGNEANGNVYDMCLRPEGGFYFVGTFTNAGADAAADYVAMWDGDSIEPVGVPGFDGGTANRINSCCIGQDNKLYVAGPGVFNADDDATARGVARYNPFTGDWEKAGRTWDDHGDITIVRSAPNGDIWIGGDFTESIDGVTTNKIARMTDFENVQPSTNPTSTGLALTKVNDILIDSSNTVYIACGNGVSNNGGVFRLDGNLWVRLGGSDGIFGLQDVIVNKIVFYRGKLHAAITNISGTEINTPIVVWDGGKWSRSDLGVYTGGSPGAIEQVQAMSVIRDELWIGGQDEDSFPRFIGANATTVTPDSTAPAQLKFAMTLETNTLQSQLWLRSLSHENNQGVVPINKRLVVGERFVADFSNQWVNFSSDGSEEWPITVPVNFDKMVLNPGVENTLGGLIMGSSVTGYTYTARWFWDETYWGID